MLQNIEDDFDRERNDVHDTIYELTIRFNLQYQAEDARAQESLQIEVFVEVLVEVELMELSPRMKRK